jgi:hypothetical protein
MAALVALCVAACSDPPATSATIGRQKTATTASLTGFQGVYEFAGKNSSSDANDPNLAGVDLVYYWSQIEPQEGVYEWNVIQSDMAPWVATGKKVILRVSTSGAADWDPPYSGDATPGWVYARGARSVHDNGAKLPVYWDTAYLSAYQSFVTQFAAHFDGNPAVAFIQPGIGGGGETLPEQNASPAAVSAWTAVGYKDARWKRTVERIAKYFNAFRTTPVYPLVDRTFFDGSGRYFDGVMKWFRSVPNWGLQDDGLTQSQTLGPDWSGRPLALEQLVATSDSGDSLSADINNAVTVLHASYLLIYRSDIIDPANAAALAQAKAAQAT